jgi:predicted dehydrogenase
MSESVERILNIAIIGAGVRGTNLARKIITSGYPARIVAAAEPDEQKRFSCQAEFNIPAENIYTDWTDLCIGLKSCDAVIIATLDNQHSGPALASLGRGWHILIEKPLADTLEECKAIAEKQAEKEKIIAVCHTLRFMSGYRKLKEMVTDNIIGDIVHIDHMEAISNIRYAHNYVRGRWASVLGNTFLLLHKCSHDIDYISWLINKKCQRVSSFGSLKYFNAANSPEGSTSRCISGCSRIKTCLYSAISLYVEAPLNEWPANDICSIHTKESHLEAIQNGPFGKCVWHANNDVVDHQAVLMEFEGNTTAVCTLTGYSATNGRRIRIQGTEGEIVLDEAIGTISVKRFSDNEGTIHKLIPDVTYHPEDKEIVEEWLSSIFHSTAVTVDAGEALRTHAIVFAAELSRIEKRTVEMAELIYMP